MNTKKQIFHRGGQAVQKLFFPNENARELLFDRCHGCFYCPTCKCHVLKINRIGTIVSNNRCDPIDGTNITGLRKRLRPDAKILEIVFTCYRCKQDFSIELEQHDSSSVHGSAFEFEVIENIPVYRWVSNIQPEKKQ